MPGRANPQKEMKQTTLVGINFFRLKQQRRSATRKDTWYAGDDGGDGGGGGGGGWGDFFE